MVLGGGSNNHTFSMMILHPLQIIAPTTASQFDPHPTLHDDIVRRQEFSLPAKQSCNLSFEQVLFEADGKRVGDLIFNHNLPMIGT